MKIKAIAQLSCTVNKYANKHAHKYATTHDGCDTVSFGNVRNAGVNTNDRKEEETFFPEAWIPMPK